MLILPIHFLVLFAAFLNADLILSTDNLKQKEEIYRKEARPGGHTQKSNKNTGIIHQNEGGKYFSVSLLTISCNIKKRCKVALIRIYIYE
jgi:hypothetical protein